MQYVKSCIIRMPKWPNSAGSGKLKIMYKKCLFIKYIIINMPNLFWILKFRTSTSQVMEKAFIITLQHYPLRLKSFRLKLRLKSFRLENFGYSRKIFFLSGNTFFSARGIDQSTKNWPRSLTDRLSIFYQCRIIHWGLKEDFESWNFDFRSIFWLFWLTLRP